MSRQRKYFGTDGIRGLVGTTPMTPDFALKLGWAAGRVLGNGHGARVLIGKDTRRSGYLFESALEAGLSAAGVEVNLLGPLPTPAVACLTRTLEAQAGVVISASHNPHHDNGVKFFSASGDKLSDEVEAAIEAMLEQPLVCVAPTQLGMVRRIGDAQARYVDFCRSTYHGTGLDGLRIVLDCANGAAYQVGPAVLRSLGAEVITLADRPDGFNINLACGSTHMDGLCAAVVEHRADIGIALDGDADRCLLADAGGNIVDGDQILFIIARHRQQRGELVGPVVGTQMSNLGLELALRELGVELLRAQVGDRYVMELLKSSGGMLGGEASGHLLCLDRSNAGDGIVAALQVLTAMREARLPLARLAQGLSKFPQILINIRVPGRAVPILENRLLQDAVRETERGLGQRGRVLLRASGTEPLIRVMVEADVEDDTRRAAEYLAQKVREAAGTL